MSTGTASSWCLWAADRNGDVTSVIAFIPLALLPDSLTSCSFGDTLVSDESFVAKNRILCSKNALGTF